jgi:hypothetical protein
MSFNLFVPAAPRTLSGVAMPMPWSFKRADRCTVTMHRVWAAVPGCRLSSISISLGIRLPSDTSRQLLPDTWAGFSSAHARVS